ncbi:hypothetical protein CH380_02300 [Leptospira adleri]|uniref:Uncharacterized protein n=1 Tax=Leptospira adleri TaxID=2023186 RepID=A0A2M9YSU7_9LEPT|nr:hypothetical protein CH380_02300 [Leptospira adleri]
MWELLWIHDLEINLFWRSMMAEETEYVGTPSKNLTAIDVRARESMDVIRRVLQRCRNSHGPMIRKSICFGGP